MYKEPIMSFHLSSNGIAGSRAGCASHAICTCRLHHSPLTSCSSYDRSCNGTLNPFWPGVLSCTLGGGGPVPLRLLLSRSKGPDSSAFPEAVLPPPPSAAAAAAPPFLNFPPMPAIQLTSWGPAPAPAPPSSSSVLPSQYWLGNAIINLPNLPCHP